MSFRLIFAMICLLVAIVASMIPGIPNGSGRRPDGSQDVFHPRRFVAVPAFALFVMFLLLATIHIVGPGQVGIPVTFGKTSSPLSQGVNFTNPFASIKKMNIRTQTYTMSAATTEGAKNGDDSIDANTRDAAVVKVDATVIYHLDRAQASSVYKKLGTNYTELLRSTSRTAIRGAFGQFNAIESATTQRKQVSAAIEKEIVTSLAARGVVVEAFQLRNVALPQGLQDAVNARLASQQLAEQQQFELAKTEKQAEIRVADARGLAESQRIIQSTLTNQYLQYLYVQSLETIAKSPNNSTVILPFDQKLTPLLNVK